MVVVQEVKTANTTANTTAVSPAKAVSTVTVPTTTVSIAETSPVVAAVEAPVPVPEAGSDVQPNGGNSSIEIPVAIRRSVVSTGNGTITRLLGPLATGWFDSSFSHGQIQTTRNYQATLKRALTP